MERQPSVLDTVQQRGSIKIPVVWWDPPELGDPPEFYLDPLTGRPTGVVPELGSVLAVDLGVELELIEIPWHEHMTAVLAGRVDMLLSFTNTPRRALSLDFAGRLLPDVVSGVVRLAGPDQTVTDLDRAGQRVGVPVGSSVIDIAIRHFPNAELVELATPLEALQSSDVDAVVDAAITKPMLNRHPALDVLRDAAGRPIVLGMEYGHPAIRQGDPRFLNWLNNWLAYHDAAGTIERWCGVYWTRWMVE